MAARCGDGLTTPHSQPAKTLTKRTVDFIALCTATVWNDPRLFALAWAAGLIGLLAGMGAFQ